MWNEGCALCSRMADFFRSTERDDGKYCPDIKSQQVTQRAINQPDYEPYFEGKVLIKGLILFIPKQYELPLVSPFSLL